MPSTTRTMNVRMIHPRLLRDLQKAGYDQDAIAAMTPEQAFNAFCSYNGFKGQWGHTFAAVLDSLRAASTPSISVHDVLADPAVTDWIKQVLSDALQRDPVKAARDVTLAAEVLQARADAILRSLS